MMENERPTGTAATELHRLLARHVQATRSLLRVSRAGDYAAAARFSDERQGLLERLAETPVHLEDRVRVRRIIAATERGAGHAAAFLRAAVSTLAAEQRRIDATRRRRHAFHPAPGAGGWLDGRR